MDTNDIANETKALADKAKALADTDVGKEIVHTVSNMAHEKLTEVKHAASASGLGGLVDLAVNLAEQKTGMDLDGDNDIGK